MFMSLKVFPLGVVTEFTEYFSLQMRTAVVPWDKSMNDCKERKWALLPDLTSMGIISVPRCHTKSTSAEEPFLSRIQKLRFSTYELLSNMRNSCATICSATFPCHESRISFLPNKSVWMLAAKLTSPVSTQHSFGARRKDDSMGARTLVTG